MEKIISLSLNKFPVVPNSLRSLPAINLAQAEIRVNLASLYHHYYFDSYGVSPPDPDPTHFEHARLLLPDGRLRVRGEGLGASVSARRNKSNELGHAFCRWVLHDHLNITYFAHLDKV